MNKLKTALFSALTLCFSHSYALDVSDDVALHGFVSQGFVYSPDNAFAGSDSEDGSFNFRELGLNGSWNISQQFRVTGQLLSRTMDEVDDGYVRVDFLLADYLAYSGEKSTFGVRLGRVKNAVGIYNSSRDIPSARPGVNVPNALYFDAFRDSLISVDGLNIYGDVLSNNGTINWQAYTGTSELDSNVMENYLIGEDIQGKYGRVNVHGLNLNFNPAQFPAFNFGLSLLMLDMRMNGLQTVSQANYSLQNSESVTAAATYGATPVEGGGLGLEGQALQQYIGLAAAQEAQTNYKQYITASELETLFVFLSMQYSYKDWLFTAEYASIDSDITLDIVGSELPLEAMTEGYYMQAEWFFQPDLTALFRYEELFLQADDRDGSQNARENDRYHGYGKGWTLGLSWDVNADWRLIGQVSGNEGTVWLPNYEGLENEETKKHWKNYMLQLSYQF